MEGFMLTNVDDLEKFFKAVSELKEDTREARIEIMRRMVKEKEATYIRDPHEFVKGKNVIKLDDIGITKGDTK